MQDSILDVHHAIDTRRIGRPQIVVIALCGLMMLVDGFDTQTISYVVPKLALEWDLAKDALGAISSSALIGSVIGYCFVSALSLRFGHKRLLVIETLVFCISTLATVLVTDMTQLLALRFITGLALGAVIPSAIAMACEYSPARRRASCVLLIYCCYSLGFVAAGIAAATVMPAYGWRSLFWIGAAAPSLLLALLMVLLPDSLTFAAQRSGGRERLSSIMQRLYPNDPTLVGRSFECIHAPSTRHGVAGLFSATAALGTLLLWSIFFINVAVFYFLQSWLPTMLTNLHYTQVQVVQITALTTVGGALSVIIVGPAMDRFGRYRVLVLLYLVSAIFVASIGVALSFPAAALMATTFCAGFCVSGSQKSVIALSALFYPADLRPTGVGWALGVGRIGGAAGPALVGMMYARQWSLDHIFYLAALPVLLAALGVMAMYLRYREVGHDAPFSASIDAPV